MVDAIPHRRPTWSAFASNEVDLAITARHVMTPMSGCRVGRGHSIECGRLALALARVRSGSSWERQ
jgi:hypothetical protein